MRSTDYDVKTLFSVAKTFVGSSDATFEDVGGHFNGMSKSMVSNLLYRGIAENIYPSILAEAIYAKISSKGRKRAYPRWDRAFDERLEKRKQIGNKLKKLNDEKAKYDFVIENYDIYKRKSASPLPLDVLEERRSKIENHLKVLCSSFR